MSETTQVIIPGGCLQNTKISLKCKAPDEKIEYTFSLASQLSSDEEIVSVQAQPPYRSSLTVDSYTYNVNIFTCRISGGRMLYDEPIRFVISTQKNTIYSFVCVLPIRQQGILIENCCGMNGVLDPATPMGTLAVGTTTTLEPGSKATVENIGSDNAAVLNFGIPKGEEGLAATVTVGTVTKGDAGSDPVVTNGGTLNAAILNFTLPTGENGETPTVQIGETTTLPAGHDATVKATTVDNVVTLFFGIPSGTTGEAGQYILNIGTVTTLPPGQDATAEIISDGHGTHSLNLSIPKGEKGDTGATGAQGPQGEKGESYANDGAVDLNVKSINSSATVATDATPYATIENTVNTAHLSRDFLLPNRPIEHVMHKGGAGGITENTVFNARNSYNADPNISFEFDIQSTATDGKFIIWHDDRTQTMLDKDIEVQTSTYDDLRALRFKGLAGTPYADMPMSSLEDWCEFLAQVNRPFYPEIKRYQTLDQVTQMVNIVKSYGLSKLATWENGSLDVLKHVRSIDPDVAVGYLDFYAEGQNLDNAIKAMQEMGNGCLNWQIARLANKENVQKILDAGVRVCGWTASDNATYLKARSIGLTTITCDYTPVFNF